MALESSSQISDPNSVTTPATSQTESTPATLGTWRLISEGCTKIEAPMMIPTTMAVACRSEMGRWCSVKRASVSRHDQPLARGEREDLRAQSLHGGIEGGLVLVIVMMGVIVQQDDGAACELLPEVFESGTLRSRAVHIDVQKRHLRGGDLRKHVRHRALYDDGIG